ncbi:hypothetical protein GGTG_04802 [Gaeumannomyces tritici R3-111a-1]|uniref:chitinase n=1 Tax=Gaeumannomyces tritici (strain R3-111a-1) TaxID=644352 RepID=J3NU50_GAET3|nr:hypothetical protein GGTG_04802 [Gaeumannomyces tritici R3-111a-1]EJT79718.1 hypothetical protein GGTG_04802 [Gaeumannomyces tritici R3-111a-1]
MQLFSLLLLALFSGLVVSQTCSPTSNCKEGCCNKFGNCGFGPDFCGANCISDCGRKSECNPGYGSEWPKRDKCPLNVCCSKHGYCGTTKDFCDDKKVEHKTCSKDSGNPRIVGYFEGWASNRPCNVFWPEQIPIGLYTQINFAFATIDPVSFKVMPATQADVNLYRRLMLIKKQDPDLRIFIAIGGWTFNDPGPTATTFSDIAASVPRQTVFIESLISFMSTYGFDGVDLDWEYPAADDRSGREVDFDNFPKFMARLRDSLRASNKGISITIPASYWYLQHFDLKALSKSVDWFNVMSYDLHGTWDKGNEWTGAFLNTHTNLTEIDQALDLIWRNDIDPGTVVLGLGFYGRAFTVTSPSCIEPGCTFESGAEMGECSREVGILLNSEIDDLVEKNGVKPKLYEKEASKVASWGNQWVSYDDEETFKLKSEYAQSMCLGGLMVWAISHDTKDAKYSKALAKVANRKITAVLSVTDGSDDTYQPTKKPIQQCKWTNCGEGCPNGWIHMKREDPGARTDEYMLDGGGCGGIGSHAFCCPSDQKLPKCGWYSHNNGRCSPECPEDYGVVGGNSQYCNNGLWQHACCSRDTKSLQLYMNCHIGCDAGNTCPMEWAKTKWSDQNTLLVSSGTGMGGANCFSQKKTNLCCNANNQKATFSDCKWYDYGLGPSDEGFCRNNCPSDRVRVALDSKAEGCKGGGKANCCVPVYYDTIEKRNDRLDAYENALKKWLEDPYCSNPGSILNGRTAAVPAPEPPLLLGDGGAQNPSALVKRATNPGQSATEDLCLNILTARVVSEMVKVMGELWDEHIGGKWSNLKVEKLKPFAKNTHEWEKDSPIQFCHDLVCSPYTWAGRVGGSKEVDCINGFCRTDGDCSGTILSRRSLTPSQQLMAVSRAPRDVHWVEQWSSARDFTAHLVDAQGQTFDLTITLPTYDSPSQWPLNHPIFDELIDYASFDDCGNLQLGLERTPNGRYYQIEHPFDGNVVARFLENAAAGTLRSGAVARTGAVSMSFFRVASVMPFSGTPPPLPGGNNYVLLFDRVMECLGSRQNTAPFSGVHEDINAAKGRLAMGKDVLDRRRWTAMCSDQTAADKVLSKLRAAISTINYLNMQSHPDPDGRLTTVVNNVGRQLAHAQTEWNRNNPAGQVQIVKYWREWVRDYYPWLTRYTRTFCSDLIAEMKKYWGVSTGDKAMQVLEALSKMSDEIERISIRTAGFD